MTKNKLIKGLQQREDKVLSALEDLTDFLDTTEDPLLSEMGHNLIDHIVDIIHCDPNYSLNEIRTTIEEEFEI